MSAPGSTTTGQPISTAARVPDDAGPAGVASLSLRVGGSVDKQGLFRVRRARGPFVRDGADTLFVGTAATGKRLK